VSVDHELAVHLDYLESTGEYIDSAIRPAIAEGKPYLHVVVSFLDAGTRNVLGFMCDVNREGRVFGVGVESEGLESLLVCPPEPFHLLGISTDIELGRVQIDSMSTRQATVLTSPVDAEYFCGHDTMMEWTQLVGIVLSSENPLEIRARSIGGAIETLRGMLTGSGMVKSYCQNVVTANELAALLGCLGVRWSPNNFDWAGEGGTPRVRVVAIDWLPQSHTPETMGLHFHETLSNWLGRKIEVPDSQTGSLTAIRSLPGPEIERVAWRLELWRVAPGRGWVFHGWRGNED
jgi:hypothetical protein